MPVNEPVEKLPVVKFKTGEGFKAIKDPVIKESSVRVWLNGREIACILALKNEMEELALGYLYSECLIRDIKSLKNIDYNNRLDAIMVETSEEVPDKKVYTVRSVTTGCGKAVSYINPLKLDHFDKINSDTKVSAESIVQLMKDFSGMSTLFKETGGAHSAAWSDGKRIIRVSEDIGRHNCVDKLLGWKLMKREESNGIVMLLSSGRISSEIVAKVLRSEVPIIVSQSAPTTGAVQLAEEFGMTIVGFSRGNRFNVYMNPERISE